MRTSQQLEYEATIREALGHRATRPAVTPSAQQGPLQQRKPDRASFILSAARIRPDVEQVRRIEKQSDDSALQQLADSIREYGLLNPIEVRWLESDDTYQIVSGERRFVATTKILGWAEVPVRVIDASPEQVFWLQLHENVHRQDLHPLDLAAALSQALHTGATLEEVAKRLCKSKTVVQKASTIADGLTGAAKTILLQTPALKSFETIYEIAKLPADRQVEMIRQAAQDGLSRDELRSAAADAKQAVASNSRGGRPAKSRNFRRIFAIGDGVRVIVQFRKTKATPEDVVTALKEALRSFAA